MCIPGVFTADHPSNRLVAGAILLCNDLDPLCCQRLISDSDGHRDLYSAIHGFSLNTYLITILHSGRNFWCILTSKRGIFDAF